VNAFRELTVRALLAVARGSCLVSLLGVPLAFPQVKSDRAEKIAEIRRTFSLNKFYDAPNPLPVGKPGDLIRSQEFDRYELPSNVMAIRILYHSRSASGQDVAASGVVLYPDGKAPVGGWPVIAWAHALIGVARVCAPSLAKTVQHGPFLSMYVGQGYAVVATDYAGLGTSVRNAFSDTPSNATDVIYSVPAARAAVPQLGSRWVAVGVGEGGSAVVGVSELEREIRDPNYLGSMAISGLDDFEDRYEHSGAHNFPEMPLFQAYGIKSVYPAFDVKDILTDRALALYSRVEQACGDPRGGSKLSLAEMLKPNWENNRFVNLYSIRNILGQKPAQGPVMVISSELDRTVPITRTAQVIARLCKQGDRVQFERYPQSDTGHVFGDSVRDQISWLQARFAGRPAASNCPEQR
jgi:hypothetical protein